MPIRVGTPRPGPTCEVPIGREQRGSGSGRGERDLEAGAPAGTVAVGGDDATMRVDDRLGDRQADAGAGVRTAAGGVDAVEAFEETLGLGGVEALAAVGD